MHGYTNLKREGIAFFRNVEKQPATQRHIGEEQKPPHHRILQERKMLYLKEPNIHFINQVMHSFIQNVVHYKTCNS
jgi:hypothetical protein